MTTYFDVEAHDRVTGNSTFVIVEAETADEAEHYAQLHYFTLNTLVEATLIHAPMSFYGKAHQYV